jgi:hypothetical protein
LGWVSLPKSPLINEISLDSAVPEPFSGVYPETKSRKGRNIKIYNIVWVRSNAVSSEKYINFGGDRVLS